MPSEKRFKFTDIDSKESLDVIIPELVDPSYGMYVWPCAPVLAQYLWHTRHSIRGKTVIEIGAGTALPGIVAGLCGAKLHLSDSSHLPNCVENSRKSCEANGLTDVHVHSISWGRFDSDLLELPRLDIILASDCFYDTKDFEDIIVTISYLLEQNKSAICLCSYQERSSARSIEYLLDKWHLQTTTIPLSSFDGNKSCLADSDLPGDHTIHCFKIWNRST